MNFFLQILILLIIADLVWNFQFQRFSNKKKFLIYMPFAFLSHHKKPMIKSNSYKWVIHKVQWLAFYCFFFIWKYIWCEIPKLSIRENSNREGTYQVWWNTVFDAVWFGTDRTTHVIKVNVWYNVWVSARTTFCRVKIFDCNLLEPGSKFANAHFNGFYFKFKVS